MWKDSIRNIVVIFQPNILRIVGFYVRHSANMYISSNQGDENSQGMCLSSKDILPKHIHKHK